MIILKRLFLALFLIIHLTGCADLFLSNRTYTYTVDIPSPFDNPIFADYETYQAALQGLDDTESMSNYELEELLFTDNYEIHPEFLPHIDYYKRLKEQFIGDSTIRSNIRFVMTDLGSIPTEADFINFKNERSLKGTSGLCHRIILNSRKPLRLIEIDYTFWVLDTSSLENRHTIFHELGHCDLDRKHEPDNAPSLMIRQTDQVPEYLMIRDLYRELFDPEKRNNDSSNIRNFKRHEEHYFSNNDPL